MTNNALLKTAAILFGMSAAGGLYSGAFTNFTPTATLEGYEKELAELVGAGRFLSGIGFQATVISNSPRFLNRVANNQKLRFVEFDYRSAGSAYVHMMDVKGPCLVVVDRIGFPDTKRIVQPALNINPTQWLVVYEGSRGTRVLFRRETRTPIAMPYEFDVKGDGDVTAINKGTHWEVDTTATKEKRNGD